MLLYTFGSAMCSFIVFLFRTECQASRISLCRHTDDLSTISTLSKSIWWPLSIWCLANKEFLSNVLWPLRVLSHVFLARVMSDQHKHSHNLYIWSYIRFPCGSLFLDLVFWLFEYTRDGANRFMGDLDVETSKNFCNSFGKSFGVGEDNKATMVDIIYSLLPT